MFYIFCEDGGAGKAFFEGFCKTFLTRNDYMVETSNGNTGYIKSLNEFIKSKNIKNGDSLLLAFDSVESRKSFDVFSIIDFADRVASERGIRTYYTEYYCFEEIFLSYDGLLEYVRNICSEDADLQNWYSALKLVHDAIKTQEKYYEVENDNIKFVISKANYAKINREKFCKALLLNVSRKIGNSFSISNGSLGKCWISPCSEVPLRNKEYVCSRCKYRCKLCNSKKKYLDIEKSSFPNMYVTFSEFLSEKDL